MHSAPALIAATSPGQQDYPGREDRPDREKSIESLRPLGGDFLKNALGDSSNILLRFRTMSLDQLIVQSSKIYHDLIKHPDSDILKKLHFLTINPSPEFMYLYYHCNEYVNFMAPNAYENQLSFFERLLMFVAHQTDTKILSISAETGKNKGLKPYLHYHLVLLQSSNRSYKRFYNAIRNQVTSLHITKGHQSALRESEVQAPNLSEGINYFNGIHPDKRQYKLKPDYYKTFPYQGL